MASNPAVKDMALVPQSPLSETAALVERLALNRDVDVDKLAKIIELHERVLDRKAEEAFNQDFLAMQPDMPEIDERGQILNRNGEVQSRYALFEDIQKTIKPILIRHGFALSFRTEWPDTTHAKTVGILTHHQGHSRTSEFLSAADTSGSKNAVQGLGSATSYGRRYTTIDLLNITTRGKDDDGKKAGVPEPPDGFVKWWDGLADVAPEGEAPLRAAWKTGSPEFRQYVTDHLRDLHEARKIKAQQADKARKAGA